MKTRETEPIAFPDDAELAALRAWYTGLDASTAIARYFGNRKAPEVSAQGVLGRIRRALVAFATSRHRADLAETFRERSAATADTAGVNVRGRVKTGLDVTRGFTEGEWLLLRTIADGLEWSYGWSEAAAQRLRFLLDFGYATGLRASELTGATLGDIHIDEHGDQRLHLVGKGGKTGKVALPALARRALDQYLVQRRLPVTRERWNPATAIVASLAEGESSPFL